jgi:hypothetical protein
MRAHLKAMVSLLVGRRSDRLQKAVSIMTRAAPLGFLRP